MKLDFLLHQKLIMDHHSLAFQVFLFLMFYGTFEWIRHEQSKCTSVTQGQQEQASNLTHQTDGSIVTSSTSTDIQVHLETEPALHTPELVSTVVHQVEKAVAAAAVELEAIELNAIATIEPVSAEVSTPTLNASTTESAIPSSPPESNPDALFPISASTIAELPLSAQSESSINTLFTFPLDVISEASSIETMTAEVTGLIEPASTPQAGSTTKPLAKKRQSRQSKKAKVSTAAAA